MRSPVQIIMLDRPGKKGMVTLGRDAAAAGGRAGNGAASGGGCPKTTAAVHTSATAMTAPCRQCAWRGIGRRLHVRAAAVCGLWVGGWPCGPLRPLQKRAAALQRWSERNSGCGRATCTSFAALLTSTGRRRRRPAAATHCGRQCLSSGLREPVLCSTETRWILQHIAQRLAHGTCRRRRCDVPNCAKMP